MKKTVFLVLLCCLLAQTSHAQYKCPGNPSLDPNLLLVVYRDSLQVDQIVWSDDDQEFLGSVLSFKERKPFLPYGTTDKKDFCHRLFVLKSLPSGDHPLDLDRVQYLTPYRPGQIGRSYYMRQANFVIVENLITAENKVYWEKVDLDGRITLITERAYDSYWSTSLVPSPNGKYILRTDAWGEPILKDPSNIAVPPKNVLNLTVTILDAWTLQPVFAAQDFVGITFGYAVSWTDSDLVKIRDSEKSIMIDPLTADVEVDSQPLDCYGPATSSSFVNAQGQFVAMTQANKKARIEVSPVGAGVGFACESRF